jgi:membrane-associated phospholipid phosphatase
VPTNIIFAILPKNNQVRKIFWCFLLSFGSQMATAQNFDIDVVKSLNSSTSNFEFETCKIIADYTSHVAAAAPLTVLVGGYIKKDKQLIRDGWYMAGALVFSSLTTYVSKQLTDRKRPFEEYSFIIKRSDGGGSSMPSGHTSSAFCTATSLSLRYRQWYVVVPAYTWAAAVGYTRMYQGVHYPSDVFMGALLGSFSGWLSFKVQRWYEAKNNLNNIGKMPE